MTPRPWRARRTMGSARWRIAVAFSFLAIVLFGVVGLLSARDARHQTEQDTMLALQQLADRMAQRLDADMAARFRDIVQLSELHEALDLNPDAGRWRTVLERLQQSSHHHSWIGVADAQGTVVAATGGLLESVNVAKRPWFQQGIQRPSVLDVHDAKLLATLMPRGPSGEPLRFVDVTAPLRIQGQTVGVVGAHLSWDWAEQRRQEAMAGEVARRGIEILVVSRAGEIELGPRKPALDAASPDLIASLVQSARFLRWSDGRTYLSAASTSKPSAEYPGMGWVVVVRQPQEQALAAAIALQRRLGWLSVLGAGMFGALGWVLADRLTRPLRRVATQAQAMLPDNSATMPHNEVDSLARTLAKLLSDLQAREAALTALNGALETRVAERTASLHQANEDLKAFSRSLSHDIQAPLGTMALLLQQALQTDGPTLPPNTVRMVQVVVKECERLRELTAELLTLAMVEQRELALAPVDHAALVRDVIGQMRLSAQAFPAVEIGMLPTLPGDAVLLRQVWANLLSNAAKFTGKVAAPRIEVQAAAQGDEVVFTVADNGAGFDEAQGERLFGVFQRLHAAAQFPGTGVGLSIVRRVVQRHGGRVWAESPPGQGARFHFALPRHPADLADGGSDGKVDGTVGGTGAATGATANSQAREKIGA